MGLFSHTNFYLLLLEALKCFHDLRVIFCTFRDPSRLILLIRIRIIQFLPTFRPFMYENIEFSILFHLAVDFMGDLAVLRLIAFLLVLCSFAIVAKFPFMITIMLIFLASCYDSRIS